MSRVALANIPALTFYKGSVTLSRRTSPIPQLTCLGKPCKSYQPDVVRCESLGGEGTEVDWKCEADLPSALRFGRVEVSCEGWSKPGDPYVLKGSCALEYRLVEVPKILRSSEYEHHGKPSWLESVDVSSTIFMILWIAFLLVIVYSLLKSCLRGNSMPRGPAPHSPGFRPRPSRWFPGDYFDQDAPPPYSKTTSDASQNQGWRPGFWTGAAVGAAGAHLFGRTPTTAAPTSVPWDWERERTRTSSWFSGRPTTSSSNDRGEGSSDLGAMRRSTGLGGSNVR